MKLPKSLPKPKKPNLDKLKSFDHKKLKFPLVIRRVVGFSMIPVLPPGTLVIGWRWFKVVKPDRIVIVEHEGKEKIKRISEIKDNQIYLLGDHPDASTDSRHFGWLDIESVKADVVWPRDKKD